MNIEEIIKKLDDIWNNCEEIDNNNLETERTGYKMYDDYIFVRDGIERLHSIIKEVREDLNNTKRLNHHFKDGNGNEYALIDIDHIDYLVKALDKVEEKE